MIFTALQGNLIEALMGAVESQNAEVSYIYISGPNTYHIPMSHCYYITTDGWPHSWVTLNSCVLHRTRMTVSINSFFCPYSLSPSCATYTPIHQDCECMGITSNAFQYLGFHTPYIHLSLSSS